MAEMIGPELGLEPICGLVERTGHDAGVRDDEVERLAVVDERVGAGADAVQRRKIKVDELKSAAVRAACSEARGGRFGLSQIARGADHVSAMSDEHARRLHAEAG
jgi:hypothetical protein